MADNITEEFMTVGDYAKVYDFLQLGREEFLNFYSYINEESYDLSCVVAMTPNYMADLMRQAENLLILENNDEEERFEHMNEVGTDYISAEQWKVAISNFVNQKYNVEQQEEFTDICESMAC